MSMPPEDAFVHVIDDDDAVRDSLAFLLEADGLPVRTYESAEVFLAQVADGVSGCIVTDVRMPGMSGLDLVRRLNDLKVTTPVVVMTGHADVPMAVEAMKAGVLDFVEKPFSDDHLIGIVRKAIEMGGRTGERAAELAVAQTRLERLTGREREVFDRLVHGAANKVIANDLGISPRTVEIYRANVMSKMEAANLSELVRIGLMVTQRL